MKKLILIILIILLFCSVGFTDTKKIETGPRVRIIDDYGRTMKLEPNSSLPVTLQDQTTPPFIVYANQVTGETTLAVATTKEDKIITVASAASISVGDYLGIFDEDDNRFYVGIVLAINSNDLTMDTPLQRTFEIGDIVGTGIRNMAVDGSVTPQIFTLRGNDPGLNVHLDVTRIIISCVTLTATELTDFGDISLGLTNGLVMRTTNGSTYNTLNWKTNIGMKGTMFDWDALEASNPGQGLNGFAGRLTFAGQSKMGVVIRVGPGDKIEFIVQDDLTSLISLYVVFEGSIAIVD